MVRPINILQTEFCCNFFLVRNNLCSRFQSNKQTFWEYKSRIGHIVKVKWVKVSSLFYRNCFWLDLQSSLPSALMYRTWIVATIILNPAQASMTKRACQFQLRQHQHHHNNTCHHKVRTNKMHPIRVMFIYL